MPSELHEIVTDDSCPVCGEELYIKTSATQDPDHAWTAYDGDDVVCKICGFLGYVSADGDGACVSYDESCEHNMHCFADHAEKENTALRLDIKRLKAENARLEKENKALKDAFRTCKNCRFWRTPNNDESYCNCHVSDSYDRAKDAEDTCGEWEARH